jgi:hypothetical protein
MATKGKALGGDAYLEEVSKLDQEIRQVQHDLTDAVNLNDELSKVIIIKVKPVPQPVYRMTYATTTTGCILCFSFLIPGFAFSSPLPCTDVGRGDLGQGAAAAGAEGARCSRWGPTRHCMFVCITPPEH